MVLIMADISTIGPKGLKLGNNSLSHIRAAGTSVHNRPIDKATDVGCFTVWVWLKQAWLRLYVWLITKPIPILLFAVFFLYPYFFHSSEQPYIIIIFIENVF